MKHHLSISRWPVFVLPAVSALPLTLHAQLPNAWQITPPPLSPNTLLCFTHGLATPQRDKALADGFRFSAHARFIRDWGTGTMTMAYGLGDGRLLIWFDLDANINLTAEVDGADTFVPTTNGTGTALYHTHEIVYDPVEGTANCLLDGQTKLTHRESRVTPFSAGNIHWEEGSTLGKGQMNFHSVRFDITGLGVVASYDAGTAGNPAEAPAPETQGWTLGGVGSLINSVAPNDVPLPTAPLATTMAATDVRHQQATLRGVIDQGYLAATVWFEWGTDTNYGNIGAVQARVVAGHPPPVLNTPAVTGSGDLSLSFTNTPNLDFTVLAITNGALPFIQWQPIGFMTQGAPGEYPFIDPQAANYPQRFSQIVSS